MLGGTSHVTLMPRRRIVQRAGLSGPQAETCAKTQGGCQWQGAGDKGKMAGVKGRQLTSDRPRQPQEAGGPYVKGKETTVGFKAGVPVTLTGVLF